MAVDNKARIARLVTYAESLKQRLAGEIPLKHKKSPEAFKQMIEIDLKKTLATIEALRIAG